DPYGVGAQEAGALLAVGDADDDAFAGEGVAYEEDLALVGAGDAVAAVCDRADLDLVLLADQRLLGFCLHGGRAPEVVGRGGGGRPPEGGQPSSLRPAVWCPGACPA